MARCAALGSTPLGLSRGWGVSPTLRGAFALKGFAALWGASQHCSPVASLTRVQSPYRAPGTGTFSLFAVF